MALAIWQARARLAAAQRDAVKAALRAWWPLIPIIALGAALRLYQVGSLPPGFYRDEAYYALDAAGVLRGNFALFFAANNGREGLFVYLLAPAIALLGHTVFAVRVTAAIIGILTIPAIAFAATALFSRRMGILSAAVLAFNFWHLAESRVAFRAITLPFVLCLAIGLWGVALRSRVRRPWVECAAGGVAALCLYTYTSGQVMLGLVACMALLYAAQPGARPRFVVILASMLLGLLPLLAWLARHYDLYLVRAGQVSILNAQINGGDLAGTLAGNIVRALGAFVNQGDRIWRHNLSLRPAFEVFGAPAFCIGLVLLARDLRRAAAARTAAVILLWFGLFLVPTILAEDTPHYLRGIGALPAACVIAAYGFEAGLAWASRRGMFMALGPVARFVSPPALAATIMLAAGAWSVSHDYFDDYVQRPITAYWLEAHNVELARRVELSDPARPILMDQRLAQGNAALRFLSARAESGGLSEVDPATVHDVPSSAAAFVDPNHDWDALRAALPFGSEVASRRGPLAQNDLDTTPREAFVELAWAPHAGGDASVAAFDNGVRLVSAQVTPPETSGGGWRVRLVWTRAGQPTADVAVFVHGFAASRLVSQHDGDPGNGLWPLSRWPAGLYVVDDVQVPAGGVALDRVVVGLYHRSDGTRVGVSGAPQGQGDSVIIWPR